MELQFFGANCIKLANKNFSIVVDDNLSSLGLKSVTKPDDISLFTSKLTETEVESRFKADMPGEYEISGAIIHGVAARAHMDEEGKSSAVIYTVEADDVRVAILGHVYPELSEDQLESLGTIDVLVLPVGGHGYTLDGAGALKLIKKIEPKVVIPTHYADKSITFEVPQAELAEAIKDLGMEPAQTVPKIKLNTADFTDSIKLIVVER